MEKIKLAILASGSGTNAEAIVSYFSEHDQIDIELILSNKKNAFVLERAERLGVTNSSFDRKAFYETQDVLKMLEESKIQYIILAGFLWLIPSEVIAKYPNKILNIHPSLLPKFGGKGMYGAKVHQAVIQEGETQSGITIHLVDEIYDNGRVLYQESVKVTKEDTAETLANKIHSIEHKFYPKVIEDYVMADT